MGRSAPGSSVHRISQARILEWVAISSPRDLPDSWIEPNSPALAGGFFTTEPPGKPSKINITFLIRQERKQRLRDIHLASF